MDDEAEDGDVIVVAPTGEERQRRYAALLSTPCFHSLWRGHRALWQVLVMPTSGQRSFQSGSGALLVALLCSPWPTDCWRVDPWTSGGNTGRLGGRGGAAQLVWTIPGPQALCVEATCSACCG